jgi:hypothetical protein
VLRTRLSNNYIKRTIRPLYGWTQATPKATFLDAAWDRTTPIYPGMAMTKTIGDNVTLCGAGSGAGGVGTAANNIPIGLAALYVGGDGIDEPLDAGINTFAVWTLTPDAEFEILAPAFDTTADWAGADAGDGNEDLVYVATAAGYIGKLTLTGVHSPTTAPIARLIRVASATKIIIGGIR